MCWVNSASYTVILTPSSTFGYAAIAAQLPLAIQAKSATLAPVKQAWRSEYRYLGHDDLARLTQRKALSDFEPSLRLVDFTVVRPELAAELYQPSR